MLLLSQPVSEAPLTVLLPKTHAGRDGDYRSTGEPRIPSSASPSRGGMMAMAGLGNAAIYGRFGSILALGESWLRRERPSWPKVTDGWLAANRLGAEIKSSVLPIGHSRDAAVEVFLQSSFRGSGSRPDEALRVGDRQGQVVNHHSFGVSKWP